jgi:hypothetical protein
MRWWRMATRFYLSSSAAAPISPTVSASWENSSGLLRRSMTVTNAGSTLTDFTLNNVTVLQDWIHFQYVSPPIDGATTISGTTRSIWRSMVTAGGSGGLTYCIRVLSNDGSSVTGTLIDQTGASRDNYNPGSQDTSGIENGSAAAVTSVGANDGDRIVLEFGAWNNNINTDDFTVRLGESAASDFAYTSNLTTDLNPWFELSTDLTFKAEGGGAAPTLPNQLMLVGVGK